MSEDTTFCRQVTYSGAGFLLVVDSRFRGNDVRERADTRRVRMRSRLTDPLQKLPLRHEGERPHGAAGAAGQLQRRHEQ